MGRNSQLRYYTDKPITGRFARAERRLADEAACEGKSPKRYEQSTQYKGFYRLSQTATRHISVGSHNRKVVTLCL